MERGLKTGGKEGIELVYEGFMQIRNIEDLDGHDWGYLFDCPRLVIAVPVPQ